MKDYQASLEKLREDTAEAARDSAKREMFDRLYQNFRWGSRCWQAPVYDGVGAAAASLT
jgi:hypothetical protein